MRRGTSEPEPEVTDILSAGVILFQLTDTTGHDLHPAFSSTWPTSTGVTLVLRSGGWQLPKGTQRGSETARQCAERKLHEEAGFIVSVPPAAPTVHETYVVRRRHQTSGRPDHLQPKRVTYFAHRLRQPRAWLQSGDHEGCRVHPGCGTLRIKVVPLERLGEYDLRPKMLRCIHEAYSRLQGHIPIDYSARTVRLLGNAPSQPRASPGAPSSLPGARYFTEPFPASIAPSGPATHVTRESLIASRVCIDHYLHGTCRDGEDCWFRHDFPSSSRHSQPPHASEL